MNKTHALTGRSSGVIRGTTAVQHLARLAAGFTVLAAGPRVHALGVRIPNQDPTAIARGNAFVATADNPSAIYYNPAGITQLQGNNAQIGSLFYLGVYADYESPSGKRVENDAEVIPVPEIHYVYSPEHSPFSFGLGVYAPFGLSMKWPDNAPFATSGIEANLSYITAAPVVAVQLHRTLSAAVGPTFNFSDLELRQEAGIVPGDRLKFTGDDVGYGFTAGLLWQPYEEWSVGLAYKSKVKMNYDGTASLRTVPRFSGSFNSSVPFEFPHIITGGVSFRPTPDWNIEVDIDWTDWNSVDRLAIQGLPSRPLDWDPSFFYEFGVTRYLKQGYYVSAGYFFSEKSTSERSFTPVVPDTNLHVGSLGGGYRGQHWQWAAAAQIIAGDWRTIGNNIDPSVNGRYRLWTPTLSVSVGYHF
ncbi:MAG TPA: outer membrane protein transport protein [Verrucomicrobiae bacterium]|nr:outer membrane protein transport protein [Verrucomicrobiae bacterium]